MPRVPPQYEQELSEWQIDASSDEFVGYAGFLDSWAASERPSVERTWLPEAAEYTENSPDPYFELVANASLGRRPGTVPAFAYIESISGPKARCLVQVAGSELPVELPLRVFKVHHPKKGMRFLWWMSEDGSVTAHDIEDRPPNRLNAQEQEEGRRLYEKLCEDIASGDDWGMKPGDGR